VQEYGYALYQAPQMDGLRIMSHGARFEDLIITDFRRNGIICYASYPPTFTPQVNSNNTQFRDLVLSMNGGNGIEIGGDDANVMTGINVDASSNGECGIFDHSFLGCLWVGCHTAANRRYNYECNRPSSPTFSAFIGCYAEQDAPSIFKGPVNVDGGDLSFITKDSMFEGSVAAAGGRRLLSVSNDDYGSVYREWPGTGSGYGLKIRTFTDDPFYYLPGNGYYYKCIVAGSTYGSYRVPAESAPVWPTTPGQTVVDGTVTWECVGAYEPYPKTFFAGPQGQGTIMTYGAYDRGLGYAYSYHWKTKLNYTEWAGRWTDIWYSSGAGTHWMTTRGDYMSRPYPGAFCQPGVHYGSAYYGERSIQATHTGTGTPKSDDAGLMKGRLMGGDIIVNARNSLDGTGLPAGEPWAWRVKKHGALPYSRLHGANATWVAGRHYLFGDVIKVNVGGTDYCFECFAYQTTTGVLAVNVTGGTEPTWSTARGSLTVDNKITWVSQGPYAPDASLEPLPRQQVLDVRDYGAKGDGVSDDRPAILAALAALPGGPYFLNGGTILFPQCDSFYRISDTIELPDDRPVTLRGHSGSNPFSGGSDVRVDAGKTAFRVRYGGTVFKDLRITTAGANTNTSNVASYTPTTNTITVSGGHDFVQGEVVYLPGSGPLKNLPTLRVTTSVGDPNITVTSASVEYVSPFGLRVGDYLVVAGAYDSPTRITQINGATITMAVGAASAVTGIVPKYAVGMYFRVQSVVGNTLTVDNPNSNGTAVTNVPLEHGACAIDAPQKVDVIGCCFGSQSHMFARGAAVLIMSSHAFTPACNANLCKIDGGYSYGQRSAVFTYGEDANQCSIRDFHSVQSVGYAFQEQSFLGNMYSTSWRARPPSATATAREGRSPTSALERTSPAAPCSGTRAEVKRTSRHRAPESATASAWATRPWARTPTSCVSSRRRVRSAS
jgi:hypothetical protein